MRVFFGNKYNVVIATSTISDIIKQSARWLNYENKNEAKRIRIRTRKHPQLEEALYIWFCEMRSFKAPITDDLLKAKAEIYTQMLYDDKIKR